MSQSTELLAIFKLEFYKKKKNWLIGVGKNKLQQDQDQRNSLNETYTVDTDSPGPSLFNDAFLESGNAPPDENNPNQEDNLAEPYHQSDADMTNNNCPEKYSNLNLTQNLEYLTLDTNPNLSKASVALAKLQNIVRNDAESQLLEKDSSIEYERRPNIGCSGPTFMYIGQTCPERDISYSCMQGWPQQSAVWTNSAYKVLDYNDLELHQPDSHTDTPDGPTEWLSQREAFLPRLSQAASDPSMIRHQLFSSNHPESQLYQQTSPPYDKDLLRHHLENLRMLEFCKFDQGDVRTAHSEAPGGRCRGLQEAVGLGDSRESLDGELFMLGAHRVPHSSEIELTVPRVFHKPRSILRQLDHRRAMLYQRSFDLSHQSLTRSPSFEDFPTRDVDPPHQDQVLASSFKDIGDFDRFLVGRGRGRLLNRGAFGPGGWKL